MVIIAYWITILGSFVGGGLSSVQGDFTIQPFAYSSKWFLLWCFHVTSDNWGYIPANIFFFASYYNFFSTWQTKRGNVHWEHSECSYSEFEGVDRNSIDIAPLSCYYWPSWWVYNHLLLVIIHCDWLMQMIYCYFFSLITVIYNNIII